MTHKFGLVLYDLYRIEDAANLLIILIEGIRKPDTKVIKITSGGGRIHDLGQLDCHIRPCWKITIKTARENTCVESWARKDFTSIAFPSVEGERTFRNVLVDHFIVSNIIVPTVLNFKANCIFNGVGSCKWDICCRILMPNLVVEADLAILQLSKGIINFIIRGKQVRPVDLHVTRGSQIEGRI